LAESPFFDVTYFELAEPSLEQGAGLLREYSNAVRGGGRDVQVEVMRRIERLNQFIVLVGAASEAPLEDYRTADPFVRLNEQLAPALAAPPDTRQHHSLTIAPATNGGPNSITAVTHVDVVPQHKDDAVVALEGLARGSRRHAGNVRFDVWQQLNRPNHFTVVETWSGRRSFITHAAADETRAFRAQLAPMTGALYDERLYRALVLTPRYARSHSWAFQVMESRPIGATVRGTLVLRTSRLTMAMAG
jgi:quinol monooxygenase YgiN